MHVLSMLLAGVTLHVPSDQYATIQSAIDAAGGMAPGVTIVVAKGTYAESLDIEFRDGLTLRGKG